jgi:hypothetical protein
VSPRGFKDETGDARPEAIGIDRRGGARRTPRSVQGSAVELPRVGSAEPAHCTLWKSSIQPSKSNSRQKPSRPQSPPSKRAIPAQWARGLAHLEQYRSIISRDYFEKNESGNGLNCTR